MNHSIDDFIYPTTGCHTQIVEILLEHKGGGGARPNCFETNYYFMWREHHGRIASDALAQYNIIMNMQR